MRCTGQPASSRTFPGSWHTRITPASVATMKPWPLPLPPSSLTLGFQHAREVHYSSELGPHSNFKESVKDCYESGLKNYESVKKSYESVKILWKKKKKKRRFLPKTRGPRTRQNDEIISRAWDK